MDWDVVCEEDYLPLVNSKVDLFLLYIVEICPSRCASMGICTRQNPSNRSSPHGY